MTLDQARARLQQMQEHVEQLKSQGEKDEARAMAKQAETLSQKLEEAVCGREKAPGKGGEKTVQQRIDLLQEGIRRLVFSSEKNVFTISQSIQVTR